MLATGEFDRTPKVNGNAGRNHWARAMFALMAGDRIRPDLSVLFAQPIGVSVSADHARGDLCVLWGRGVGVGV